MRRRIKYDALAFSGFVLGLFAGLYFRWPLATVLVGLCVAALLALTHLHGPRVEPTPVPRPTWTAAAVVGLVLVPGFNLDATADAFSDDFSAFDRAQLGLIATFGACLGIAAMARPRPHHVWPLAALIGCGVYIVALFVWFTLRVLASGA